MTPKIKLREWDSATLIEERERKEKRTSGDSHDAEGQTKFKVKSRDG